MYQITYYNHKQWPQTYWSKVKISINSVRPIISASGELFGSLKCQANEAEK